MRTALALAAAVMFALAGSAWATTVMVMSLTQGKAQLIINGSTIRSLTAGDSSPEGVKLISATPTSAVIEVDGRAMTFRLGDATQTKVTLAADHRGQYFTTTHINGVPLRSQIDTGATLVVLNMDDARAAGVDFSQGKIAIGRTANGAVRTLLVTLRSVQLGGIELKNVPASVMEGGREQLPHVLVGMSFLRYVEMRRAGDHMELIKTDR